MTHAEACLLVEQQGWSTWGRGIMVPWAMAHPKRMPVVEPREEGWAVVFKDSEWPPTWRPDYGLAFNSREDANVAAVTVQLMRAVS